MSTMPARSRNMPKVCGQLCGGVRRRRTHTCSPMAGACVSCRWIPRFGMIPRLKDGRGSAVFLCPASGHRFPEIYCCFLTEMTLTCGRQLRERSEAAFSTLLVP